MDAFNLIAHGKLDPAFWNTYPNYFTWLFLVSTAVNLYFIIELQGSKEKKQNTA